jgi:hypothetical protein
MQTLGEPIWQCGQHMSMAERIQWQATLRKAHEMTAQSEASQQANQAQLHARQSEIAMAAWLGGQEACVRRDR